LSTGGSGGYSNFVLARLEQRTRRMATMARKSLVEALTRRRGGQDREGTENNRVAHG
jgi:hypothetical protein